MRDSLENLISQCDPNAPPPEDMAVWELMTPVGNEEVPYIYIASGNSPHSVV